MPTGILKYKQDDGSIVELTPAGFVPQTTYDAGQAVQDGRLNKLETVTYSTKTRINLTMVPLQKGSLVGERYFISPVPLAASPTPGCYTPTSGDGTGNCDYWCADSNGIHTFATRATSFEVVDRHLMLIKFEQPDTDADTFNSAAPIGYTLSGAWPTFMLELH